MQIYQPWGLGTLPWHFSPERGRLKDDKSSKREARQFLLVGQESLDSDEVRLLQFKTTWTGIIDEWAGRFFDELDYSREARNAVVFKEQMAALEGIKVPDVFPELCSQEVLTTAWVEGKRFPSLQAW